MTSGGARARSGPAPDPNALRRDRPDDKTWLILPEAGSTPAPAWPLTAPPSPAEMTHWLREWNRPQASEWLSQGQEVEVALYVRCLAEAEMVGAAVNLRAETRLRSEHLGISLAGLLKNRWVLPTGDAPAVATPTTTARPAGARPSARERFTVVPDVG